MKNKIFNIIIVALVLCIGLIIFLMLKKEDTVIINTKSPELIVNDEVVNLYVGNEYQINYKFNDNDTKTTLEWQISDKNVISVNNGKVKALSKGVSYVEIKYFYKDKEYIEKVLFIVNELDEEAPIITVSNYKENEWSNNDVNLIVNIEDKSSYKSNYYIENENGKSDLKPITNNTIIVSDNGINNIYIEATDIYNHKSTKSIVIKIDKIKPTCSLKLIDNNGKYTITIEKKDNNELIYYGTDKNFSGDNVKKLEAKVGKYHYYVKDQAGNTNSCSMEIIKTTKYRKSTCKTCNGCKESGCIRYSDWITTGTHCNDKQNASDYIGEYEKYTNCRYDTGCSSTIDTGDKERPDKFYRCTRAIRSCTEYKTSCEQCGCSAWNPYGEWTNQVIKENKTTKVEKKEGLLQK